ncbi:MAG: nitroreductase family protein [Chitinispirillales bacterium]|jgi:SagB-type dehydrogenase family enzyme|nr:nitroreductase family protein [Chitinispirillales bacterium]
MFSKNQIKILFVSFIFFIPCSIFAQKTEIKLPQPNKTGGMPLMEALANRKTSRDFSSKELSNQQLGNLLWAMWGINRSDGKRTAPSARNWQETELFVVKPEAVYKYNAKNHSLEEVKSGDHRNIAGAQDFAKKAPLNILLAANTALMGKDEADDLNTAHIDAGFIAQNAYLYCTSEGLNCVVRLMIDRDEIRKTLGFDKKIYPIAGLTIGY